MEKNYKELLKKMKQNILDLQSKLDISEKENYQAKEGTNIFYFISLS